VACMECGEIGEAKEETMVASWTGGWVRCRDRKKCERNQDKPTEENKP